MACVDCASGVINSGSPKGSESVIYGLPTYVAQPSGPPKGLIVMIPDAFGWEFSNLRVLADSYAEKGGHLVYMPEFMNGHGCPISVMGLMDQLLKPASWFNTIFWKPVLALRASVHFFKFLFLTRRSICGPRILGFFGSLRATPLPEVKGLKVGVAGYCWGGQYVVMLANDAPSSRVHREGAEAGQVQPFVDCAYTAHPSFLDVPKDIEGVTVPLSIAVGDVDMALKVDKVRITKELLEKKKAGDHEVIIYPGAKHGFAVRGDPEDALQIEMGEKARTQALSWFSTWLS